MMGFGGILGILLIAVIVWAVIKFINKSGSNNIFRDNQREPSVSKENASDILKKRYASGEINQKEFEQMKKDLE